MKRSTVNNDPNYRIMKNQAICFLIALIVFGCTREEQDLPNATFPNTAEVFTDVPVSLTDEFFISFDPAEGANTSGFGVDETIFYEGTTSIRIDVPGPDDPDGAFIGGIFKDRGDGRDLTTYNALTFWAKATTSATIGLLGFGTDFEDNTYAASLNDVLFTTGWKKYIIPIPDPAKLTQVKGMFTFSAGTQSTGGLGYTFWIDEMKFEKLGTLAQPDPAILNGNELSQLAFEGVTTQITGLTQTFSSVENGEITVNAAPSYYNFSSSDESVVTVDALGGVEVVGMGEADITAEIGGIAAEGSLTLDVSLEPGSIISLFSDIFPNVPVDNYNGFYTPDGQTTLGGAVSIGDENIIRYTMLNFVGIEFYGREGSSVSPIDASSMTHLHIDIRVNELIESGDFIRLELLNDVGSGQASSFTVSSSDLAGGEWVEFDIPFTDFTDGLSPRESLGILILVSDATISNIDLDNIYFYRN